MTPQAPAISEERMLPGFIARDLTDQLAGYLGVKTGMLVTEVAKGSVADKAGLVAGDVVVGTEDQDVRSVLELKALFSARPEVIKLRVYRNKAAVSIDIPAYDLPKAKR
jgi:serine protease Do